MSTVTFEEHMDAFKSMWTANRYWTRFHDAAADLIESGYGQRQREQLERVLTHSQLEMEHS